MLFFQSERIKWPEILPHIQPQRARFIHPHLYSTTAAWRRQEIEVTADSPDQQQEARRGSTLAAGMLGVKMERWAASPLISKTSESLQGRREGERSSVWRWQLRRSLGSLSITWTNSIFQVTGRSSISMHCLTLHSGTIPNYPLVWKCTWLGGSKITSIKTFQLLFKKLSQFYYFIASTAKPAILFAQAEERNAF